MNVETGNGEIFDYAGLGKYLRIAPGTLRHWVMAGKIPYTKVGFHVRFRKSDIDPWFESLTYRPEIKTGRKETGTDNALLLLERGACE